jgi:ABC-type transport system substrate-binding protein
MAGLALPTANLVPNNVFGHEPALKAEVHDITAARRLLGDAGYDDGFGLTIHGPLQRYTKDSEILQVVAQNLACAGIKAAVEAPKFSHCISRANKHRHVAMIPRAQELTADVHPGEPAGRISARRYCCSVWFSSVPTCPCTPQPCRRSSVYPCTASIR